MLQINFIKNNIDFVKERLAIKHFKQLDLVDAVVAIDPDDTYTTLSQKMATISELSASSCWFSELSGG